SPRYNVIVSAPAGYDICMLDPPEVSTADILQREQPWASDVIEQDQTGFVRLICRERSVTRQMKDGRSFHSEQQLLAADRLIQDDIEWNRVLNRECRDVIDLRRSVGQGAPARQFAIDGNDAGSAARHSRRRLAKRLVSDGDREALNEIPAIQAE